MTTATPAARRLARLVCMSALAMAGLMSRAARASAQPSAVPDTAAAPVRVYLDCDSFGCDRSFFMTEMAYIAWMRDRLDADVHAIVTSLGTGSGGREYTITLAGQRRFAGLRDTLVYSIPPNLSDDLARQRLGRALRVGLLPYLLRTPVADQLDVTVLGDAGSAASARPAHDPWHFWTFTPNGSASLSGQSQQTFINAYANFSADRVTERWKILLNLDASINRARYTFEGDSGEETSVFRRRGYSTSGRAVRALGGHWSLGLSGAVGYSDFRNQRLAARLGPTVEWNLFPWTEATRRQLTFAYSVRGQHFDYLERTVYGQLEETRASHITVVSLDTRQPWGTVQWAVRGSQYLHDVNRTNLSGGVDLRLRIARGLSLRMQGDVARVRDQLYLSGEGLSRDEVLLQQRALATSYTYFTSMGLSYTFGSIYSNAVNPRLDAIERAQ